MKYLIGLLFSLTFLTYSGCKEQKESQSIAGGQEISQTTSEEQADLYYAMSKIFNEGEWNNKEKWEKEHYKYFFKACGHQKYRDLYAAKHFLGILEVIYDDYNYHGNTAPELDSALVLKYGHEGVKILFEVIKNNSEKKSEAVYYIDYIKRKLHGLPEKYKSLENELIKESSQL